MISFRSIRKPTFKTKEWPKFVGLTFSKEHGAAFMNRIQTRLNCCAMCTVQDYTLAARIGSFNRKLLYARSLGLRPAN